MTHQRFIVQLLNAPQSFPQYLLRKPEGERLLLDLDLNQEHDVDLGTELNDVQLLEQRRFSRKQAYSAIANFMSAVSEENRHYLQQVRFRLLDVMSTTAILPLEDCLLRILPPLSLEQVSCAWRTQRAGGKRSGTDHIFYRRPATEVRTPCMEVRASRTLEDGQVNRVTGRYGLKGLMQQREVWTVRAERFPFYERAWCQSFWNGWNIEEAARRAMTEGEAKVMARSLAKGDVGICYADIAMTETDLFALAGMADIMGLPISLAPHYSDASEIGIKVYGFPWHLVVWQP